MDIEQLVRRKFKKVRITQGKNGIDYVVPCPYCGKHKCYINPLRGIFHCFRCDEAGPMERVLGKVQHVPAAEVKEPPKLPVNVRPPGSLVPLTILDQDNPAVRYLNQRNFDIAELNDVYGVRYCESGRIFGGVFDTTNTLVFPMWMHHKLVGWQARLLYNPDKLDDRECEALCFQRDEDGDWHRPPKYWTAPGMPKGRFLYNFDMARQSQAVVICEGVFDSMAVGRCGVATLGKGVADDQIHLVRAFWDIAIILLDPGDADTQMTELFARFRPSVDVVRVNLTGYKDAGEAPRGELWKQIWEAARIQGYELSNYRILL